MLLAATLGGGVVAISWPLQRPFVGTAFESLALALLTLLGVAVAILLLALDVGRAGARVAPSQTLDPVVVGYLGGYLVCVAWLLQFSYFLQSDPSAATYCLQWPVTSCMDSIIYARLGLGVAFALAFSLLPFLHRTFARVSPPGLYVVLQTRIFNPRAAENKRDRSVALYGRYLGIFLAERDLAAVRAGVEALVIGASAGRAREGEPQRGVVAMMASLRGAAVDAESLEVLEEGVIQICKQAGSYDPILRDALLASLTASLTIDARRGRVSGHRSVRDLAFGAEVARLAAKGRSPIKFGAFVQSSTERLESGLALEDRDTARRVLHEIIRIGYANLKVQSHVDVASDRGVIAAAISRTVRRVDALSPLDVTAVSEVLDLALALAWGGGLRQAQKLVMALLGGGGYERARYVTTAISPARLSRGDRTSRDAARQLIDLKLMCGRECIGIGQDGTAAILLLSATSLYADAGCWDDCLVSLRLLLQVVWRDDLPESIQIRRETRGVIVRIEVGLAA